MTRDPYTEHMDEMLRLGGAHECASDCPMPLPRRRPDPRASAPEPNLYDRIAASAEGSPHAEPYKLSAPEQGHTMPSGRWCPLPEGHRGPHEWGGPPSAPEQARIEQVIRFVERMREPDIVRPDEERSLRHLLSLVAASGAQAVLPLDVERLPTADLVAELARRNKPTDSEAVARLLNGLSEAEILDFADWGAVTADQARDYLRALSSIPVSQVDREHAAWCYLPADHLGMCEGDQ